MKNITIFLLTFFAVLSTFAQSNPADAPLVHRIVFQVASSDTLVHKSLIRQLNNILEVQPDAQLEVVCHGPGLDMLLKDKSVVQAPMDKLTAKGIVFLACENTMKQRNLTREALVTSCGTVPSALLEISTRQQQGWSYIKAGF